MTSEPKRGYGRETRTDGEIAARRRRRLAPAPRH